MKVIHFVIDDKFIDGAITLFESDERVENHYVIFQYRYEEYRYLKNDKIERLIGSDILKIIEGYDVVVLHSLPAIPVQLIWKIPSRVKVVWYAWGYDMYEGFFKNIIPTPLYGPQTKQYLNGHKKTLTFRNKLRFWKKVVLHKLFLKKSLGRIDYFSGVFPYECDEIKKNYPNFNAEPLDFYYGSRDFFIPENPDEKIAHGKKNVILGNSGNATNNHLDVLQILKENNCNIDGQLIIPLSYGCDSTYADDIYSVADSIFPKKVNALRQYMPLADYLNLTSNCRVAIYAHNRQQASDNIFLQLIYGAKVYMPETSLAYHYLKKIGLKVFSLEHDIGSWDEEISDADVMENRRILSSLYSSSKLLERIKKINDILIKAC